MMIKKICKICLFSMFFCFVQQSLIAASNETASAASTTPGATTSVTITFTLDNTWPAGGYVDITFPTDFDVSNVTVASLSGNVGAFSFNGLVGNQVQINRASGGDVNGNVSITISDVILPNTTGLTGTFLIEIGGAQTGPSSAPNGGWPLPSETGTAPGIVIGAAAAPASSSGSTTTLGGGRNTSKFCMVKRRADDSIAAILVAFFLLSAAWGICKKSALS